MKKITLILCLLFTVTSFADSGDGSGGLTIRLSADEVDALASKSGEYARLADLREGFVKFEGAEVADGFVILDPQKPRNEVRSIILRDGRETSIFSVIGGDMGGGGK